MTPVPAVDPVTPDGTPERVWRDWWPRGVAPLDLGVTAAAARVVVLAAHPDDEVLAVGGLCRRLHDRGVPLSVVWASDGGAAFDHVMAPGEPARAGLSQTRRVEALRGLDALGIAPSHRFLGLPDGGLVDHADELHRALDDLVGPQDVVLAPWSLDRHPDHEICGSAAVATRAAHVWQYPVWLWHWARPDSPGVPWHRMRGVVLSQHEVTAKAAAVAEHRSQLTVPPGAPEVGAVLPASVLAYFRRSMEVVFT